VIHLQFLDCIINLLLLVALFDHLVEFSNLDITYIYCFIRGLHFLPTPADDQENDDNQQHKTDGYADNYDCCIALALKAAAS
jgi:hypothetical protein